MKITVAIPAYNCEKQITRVLDGFSRLDPKTREKIHRVVVIDNRSLDNTAQTARDFIRNQRLEGFEVWRNRQNIGLGGSHKVAFQLAHEMNCDFLSILHGDNQARTEELADLVRYVDEDPTLEAVLGARFMRESSLLGYSKIRTYGNRGLNLIYTLAAGQRTYDLGSGLNLFKVSSFDLQELLQFQNGFTFNIDLLLYMYRKKLGIQFVPISWSETDQVSNAKALKVGTTALKMLCRWRLNRSKRLREPKSNYLSDKIS